MKAVKRSELVVGKVYADCLIKEKQTFFRVEKYENDSLYLRYVSGEESYHHLMDEKGFIVAPTDGIPFYEVENTELSEKSLATITTALRRYFDDYPIVKGSKEDDVINAIDELIEKFNIKQLEPLRDEMNKDLGFESNQESNTDPNEDRENDVEWNNRPNQYI